MKAQKIKKIAERRSEQKHRNKLLKTRNRERWLLFINILRFDVAILVAAWKAFDSIHKNIRLNINIKKDTLETASATLNALKYQLTEYYKKRGFYAEYDNERARFYIEWCSNLDL